MALTGPGALAVEAVMLVLSALFVILRLYTRVRILRKFGASDALVVFAWICLLCNEIGDLYSYRWGLWSPKLKYSWKDGKTVLPDFEAVITDTNTLVKALKLQYGFALFLPTTFYCVKMSFCAWYLQLFPPNMTRLRVALWFVIIYTTAIYIVSLGLGYFVCEPIRSNWSAKKEGRCISGLDASTYIFDSFNILFTDLLIVILPFFLTPTIKRSNPSRMKLAGIVAVFCVGLLSILSTIIRVIYVGMGADTQRIMAWLCAEVSTGIIAACLPPLFSLKAGIKRPEQKHGTPAGVVDDRQSTDNPDAIRGATLNRAVWGSEESKETPRDVETAGTNWTGGSFYAEGMLNITADGLAPRTRNLSGASSGLTANAVAENIAPLESSGALNSNSQNWKNRWLTRHGSLKSKDGRKGSEPSLHVTTFGANSTGPTSMTGHSGVGYSYHPATPASAGLHPDVYFSNYAADRRPSGVSVAEQSDANSYYHRPSIPALAGLSAPPSNMNSPTHHTHSHAYNSNTIGGGISNNLNRRSLNAGFGFLNFWGRDSGGAGTAISARNSRRFSSAFGEGGPATPTLGSPNDISSGFSDSRSDLGRTFGSDSPQQNGMRGSMTGGSSSCFTGYGSSNVGSSPGQRRSSSPHTFQPPRRSFGAPVNRDSFGTSIFGTSV